MTVDELIQRFLKLDAEMGNELLCVVTSRKGHGNFGPSKSHVFDLSKNIWSSEGPIIRVVDRDLGPHTLQVIWGGSFEAHHQMKFWAGHSLAWLKENAAAEHKLHSAVPYETAPIVEVAKIDAAATWCLLATAASVGGIFGTSMAPAAQSKHTMRFAGNHAPPEVSWIRTDFIRPFEKSAALLEVLSGRSISGGGIVPSASPPVIDPFGLPEPLAQRFREHSAKFERLDRLHRGIMEFGFLLGSYMNFISVARAHAKDPNTTPPSVFARKLIFILQGGRDAVLQLIPSAERAEPAARMQRAIEAVAGVLAAFQSVPIEQLHNREESALKHGPWVEWISKIGLASDDVARSINLHSAPQPSTPETPPPLADVVSWQAQAIALRHDNPAMSVEDLAKLLNRNPGTIYRAAQQDPEFAQKMGISPRTPTAPKGSKEGKTGEVKVEDPRGYNLIDAMLDLDERAKKRAAGSKQGNSRASDRASQKKN